MDNWDHSDLNAQFASHAPRLLRIAHRIVGDHHLAEEVLQEVSLRLWRKSHTFRGQAQWTTWLHRLVVNCAIDASRRESRTPDNGCEVEMVRLSGDAVDPAVAAEKREQFEQLMAAVRRLPDDCREEFILTQLDGYTYDEAASILDRPRGTIASRVARAKQALFANMTESSSTTAASGKPLP